MGYLLMAIIGFLIGPGLVIALILVIIHMVRSRSAVKTAGGEAGDALKDYISSTLAQGHSIDVVRNQLKIAGWTEQQIEAALAQHYKVGGGEHTKLSSGTRLTLIVGLIVFAWYGLIMGFPMVIRLLLIPVAIAGLLWMISQRRSRGVSSK